MFPEKLKQALKSKYGGQMLGLTTFLTDDDLEVTYIGDAHEADAAIGTVPALEMLSKFGDAYARLNMNGQGDVDEIVSFKHRDFRISKKDGKIYIEFKGTMQFFPTWMSFEKHFNQNSAWYMNDKVRSEASVNEEAYVDITTTSDPDVGIYGLELLRVYESGKVEPLEDFGFFIKNEDDATLYLKELEDLIIENIK